MSFDPGPTFSFADQPTAEGRTTTRTVSLLDLLPEREARDLEALMRTPEPAPPVDDPRGPASRDA